jgi:hypothetical protein
MDDVDPGDNPAASRRLLSAKITCQPKLFFSQNYLAATLSGGSTKPLMRCLTSLSVSPQPKRYDPLRARGASPLGTVVNIIARKARAFDELRN